MRRGLALLTALLLGVVPAGVARADGDPASDVLPVEDVFTPYPAPSNADDLVSSVNKVYAAGQRVKVAVIARKTDLGSVPSLFGKANEYAHFLGIELSGLYTGPLLIVMPSGFGVFDAGNSTKAEATVLAQLNVNGSSAESLITSAAAAVDSLAAAKALVSPDKQKPQVYASPAIAHSGKTVTLTYHVLENSEHTGETVTIRAGKKVITVLHSPMKPVIYNVARKIGWKAHGTIAHAGLTYCVVAIDPSGNRSASTCAAITFR